jgi:hypothetical protein
MSLVFVWRAESLELGLPEIEGRWVVWMSRILDIWNIGHD